MERWVGKVAIVTGASAGIGASIAEKLVEQGVIVAGFARRKERIEEHAQKLKGGKGKLFAVKVDISKEDQVIEGFNWVKKNLGPIHILVNNAGIGRHTDLIDGDAQKWKEVLDTNVFGLCVATREAVKDMKENKVDGHIIHINSIAGHKVMNYPKMNVYPATKHAVRALAETLRFEFVQNNLKFKITNLSPGFVKTEALQASGFAQEVVDLLKDSPALQSEDIANGVLYALGTPPHVQNLSPGYVKTEIFQASGFGEADYILSSVKDSEILQAEDIANAVLYIIGTPPHVWITELTIKPVGEAS